jgi:hypothetical protein
MRQLGFILSYIISHVCFAQNESFEWKTRPIRDDLYIARNIEIAQNLDLENLNSNATKSLMSYEPELTSGRVSGLDFTHSQQILNSLLTHPLYTHEEHDFDLDRRLGLCFGRAMFLHLQLLRYGVNKDSIKKIFVIGPISPGSGIVWQFHVATLVKDSKTNDWWALDTNIGKPIKVNQWIAKYQTMSTDKTFRIFRSPLVDRTLSLRFYITEPQKLGPSSWEYNIKPGGLFDESYNLYFEEMFRDFKKNPIPKEKKFNFNQCQKLFN